MDTIKKNINDLTPYENNSRTHSDEQINLIINSIKKFGFTNPLLIDEDNNIIAGHGRLLAVKKMEWQDVPCIIVKGLSQTQLKALNIADNQIALNAGWDLEKLTLEIKGLKEENFDVASLGFNNLELSNFLNEDFLGNTSNEEIASDQTNNFIIQYNIIFDDNDQQQVWFEFLKNLKGVYVDKQTIGERVIEFIKDSNYGKN
tara:strand:+ start:243 stop:848 length:606 start_codon:yes stop_codon:yes gene_type:complete